MTTGTSNKSKLSIWGISFLNLLMPGLAQISCGKIKRGIIWYFLAYLVTSAAAYICIYPLAPLNIIFAAILIITFYLLIVLDAQRIAKDPLNSLNLKPLAGYSVLVSIVILHSLIINPVISGVIKHNFIQAYQFPSKSMTPTILQGDRILVNKYIYKSKDPSHGDVVIFPYPKKPKQDYLKRIIAIGGDKIEIKSKKVFINGQELTENYAVKLGPKIIKQRDDFGPITIPADSVFVMGDNRDNSYDSRYWGAVKKKDIKAKVINIYWSWDSDTGKVRWSRLGMSIN